MNTNLYHVYPTTVVGNKVELVKRDYYVVVKEFNNALIGMNLEGELMVVNSSNIEISGPYNVKLDLNSNDLVKITKLVKEYSNTWNNRCAWYIQLQSRLYFGVPQCKCTDDETL